MKIKAQKVVIQCTFQNLVALWLDTLLLVALFLKKEILFRIYLLLSVIIID